MNYNELNNLKTNCSASLAELKDFLSKLKGRDPQEVIGIVSTSLLVQSLIAATLGTVLFMAVFTVLPYYLYGPLKPTNVATKPEPAKSPAAIPPSPAPAASGGESKPAGSGTKEERAAKALGIDEAKPADPTKNPLDKGPNLDKLLDGLDK